MQIKHLHCQFNSPTPIWAPGSILPNPLAAPTRKRHCRVYDVNCGRTPERSRTRSNYSFDPAQPCNKVSETIDFSPIWEESACAVIRFARVTYIQDSDGAATDGVCRSSKIYAEYRPYGHLIYLCHVNPVHSYHLHIILSRSRRNIPQIILVIAGIGR